MMSNDVWATNIQRQVAFWEGMIWRRAAGDPSVQGLSLQDYSWLRRSLISAPADDEILRPLDVGSGLFSALGKVQPGDRVDVVRTDMLGDAYNRLLD
jgi:hypothetical protein